MRQADFSYSSAQGYFSQVGAGEVTPPIDANRDDIPDSAIPDELVLDGPAGGPQGSSELEQASGPVIQYNNTIQSVASSSGFTVVDINTIFNNIITTFQASGGEDGYQTNGLNLRPVPGELFSFDGIHPTNRGSVVIANNKTIEAINNDLGSNINQINAAKISKDFPVASN